MKSLRDRELIFTENHILETYSDGYVMMDWEDGIMKEHARAACHNQGDILEVGFGMGISAGYIQSFSPKSHTIMEFHPQVLEKLHKWAKDKEGVKIIEGDWIENLEELKLYDGIFFDTYLDKNNPRLLMDYLKPGGVFTFFNPNEGKHLGLDCEYKKMEVNPDKNDYFRKKTYYLPVYKKM